MVTVLALALVFALVFVPSLTVA